MFFSLKFQSPPNDLKICLFSGLKREASSSLYLPIITHALIPPLSRPQSEFWVKRLCRTGESNPGPPASQSVALPQSYGYLVDRMLFWTKLELFCHSHSHTYLFESWLGSEESSISTISFDLLGDPFFLERNSVFLVPSGMNLIPRYALLHLASLGFRNGLRSVSNSSLQGPKKQNFPLEKMDLPVCHDW